MPSGLDEEFANVRHSFLVGATNGSKTSTAISSGMYIFQKVMILIENSLIQRASNYSPSIELFLSSGEVC